MAGYLVDGPLIHAAHHEGNKIGYSIALRLLLPAAGLGIGFAVASSDPAQGGASVFGQLARLWVDGLIGFSAGMITASVVDGVALGWGPPSGAERSSAAPSRLHVVPSIAVAVDARRDPTPVFGVAGSL